MKHAKLLLLAFVLLYSVTKVMGQMYPAFAWAKQIAGSNIEYITASHVDAAGNIYVTGAFEGSVDFDPGPALFPLIAFGQRDIFVAKYAPTGNLVWAKQIGGPLQEESRSLVVDNANNIYIGGFFEGTTDFDPSASAYDITSKGAVDVFILKLDQNGDLVWVNQCGGSSYEHLYNLTLDASNNLYAVGYFSDTTDFDPSPATYNLISGGGSDAYITKFNAGTGALIWAKQFKGSAVMDYNNANRVIVNTSGEIFLSGTYKGTIDFDPSAGTYLLSSTGSFPDFYFCKMDNNCNLLWIKSLDMSGMSLLTDMYIDNAGNIFLTGDFENTADFDPGTGVFNLTANGNSDIFILKLDASGNFVWAKSMGGTGYDTGYDVYATGTEVYLLGQFQETVDFDPGTPIYYLYSDMSSWDIFLLKLDGSGNFQWVKQFAGSDTDAPTAFHMDAVNNIYITGYFSGSCDFDPDLPIYILTANQVDAFILKLNSSLTELSASQPLNNPFNVYPTLTNGKVYIQNGQSPNYEVKVYDLYGRMLLEKENTTEISLEKYPAGMYRLQIIDRINNRLYSYAVVLQ